VVVAVAVRLGLLAADLALAGVVDEDLGAGPVRVVDHTPPLVRDNEKVSEKYKAMSPGRKALAKWVRRFADRIDHAGAPKITHWSFTFKEGRGLVFRQDGRGCPVAYLGDGQYARAHSEAGGYPSLAQKLVASAFEAYSERMAEINSR
jgi:hypothetical protein